MESITPYDIEQFKKQQASRARLSILLTILPIVVALGCLIFSVTQVRNLDHAIGAKRQYIDSLEDVGRRITAAQRDASQLLSGELLTIESFLKTATFSSDEKRAEAQEVRRRIAQAIGLADSLQLKTNQLIENRIKLADATNEIPANVPNPGKLGVVFGADVDLQGAQYEQTHGGPSVGLERVEIYLRHGVYRSVCVFDNRNDADKALIAARNRRQDAYIVTMTNWCPNPTEGGAFKTCPTSNN